VAGIPMGKFTINGPFSIAMLNYQRVTPICGSMVAIDQDMFFFVQRRLQGVVKPATMGM